MKPKKKSKYDYSGLLLLVGFIAGFCIQNPAVSFIYGMIFMVVLLFALAYERY